MADGDKGRTRKQEGKGLVASFDYDVVIVGSGFGGSVAALCAAEPEATEGVIHGDFLGNGRVEDQQESLSAVSGEEEEDSTAFL